MGFFDFIAPKKWISNLYGKEPADAKASGAFNQEGVDKLGQQYPDYLSEIFSQDPRGKDYSNDPTFERNSNLIRDKIAQQTGAERQRVGDQALASGFNDGGYLEDIFGDIGRSGTAAYAESLTAMLNSLEDRDYQRWETEMAQIFPYLAQASDESLNLSNINIGKKLSHNQGIRDKGTEIGQITTSGFGQRMGSSGGGGPGS